MTEGNGFDIQGVLRDNGFTMVDVAEKVGLSKQNFRARIKGKVTLSLAVKIANATNIPLSEIAGMSLHAPTSATSIQCPHCGETI